MCCFTWAAARSQQYTLLFVVHGRFVSFDRVQSKASAASAPARVHVDHHASSIFTWHDLYTKGCWVSLRNRESLLFFCAKKCQRRWRLASTSSPQVWICAFHRQTKHAQCSAEDHMISYGNILVSCEWGRRFAMACWTSPPGVPLTEKEGAVGSDLKLDCRRTACWSN